MAAGKRKSTRKTSTKKPARKRSNASRKNLRPSGTKRGLEADAIALDGTDPATEQLHHVLQAAGGVFLGAYHEPLSGRPVVLAALPTPAVQPTPFQRDLSPTHAKRLAEKIEQAGSFLDPIIVVQGDNGALWSPNGRHRLAAAKKLGLRFITALVCTDPELAFRILALNTEKAHNLKDQSLEVIRMARALAVRQPRRAEQSFATELEAPELLTLGIVYENNKRFAGGAYRPCLRKVDRFSSRGLAASLRQREGWAQRLEAIDADVKSVITQLQARGFKSPYLRTYVVARINPVRFFRAKRGDTTPPMTLSAALTRMKAAAKRFDVATVKLSDLSLVAAVASD